MGRGKFGPATRGPWGDDPWQGWWGDDPPFRKPVFVVTHHERVPLTLTDTTFTFVTDGIESALAQAKAAAGDKDVFIGGGADLINQYLAAGLVDELELHVTPILLGDGARLFEGVGPDLKLEELRAIEAPGVAHLKYRVVKHWSYMSALEAVEARIWSLLHPYRGELESATIYGMPSLRWPGAKAHDYFAAVRAGKNFVSLYLLVGTPTRRAGRIHRCAAPAPVGQGRLTFPQLDDDMAGDLERCWPPLRTLPRRPHGSLTRADHGRVGNSLHMTRLGPGHVLSGRHGQHNRADGVIDRRFSADRGRSCSRTSSRHSSTTTTCG